MRANGLGLGHFWETTERVHTLFRCCLNGWSVLEHEMWFNLQNYVYFSGISTGINSHRCAGFPFRNSMVCTIEHCLDNTLPTTSIMKCIIHGAANEIWWHINVVFDASTLVSCMLRAMNLYPRAAISNKRSIALIYGSSRANGCHYNKENTANSNLFWPKILDRSDSSWTFNSLLFS